MQKESRLIDFGPAANRHRLFLSAASVFFVLASSALAQAWLPPKGEASFGVAYQNTYTRDHWLSEGEKFDRGGRIRMNMVVFGLTYSFTDRLAAGASVPYVVTRYDGKFRHVEPGFERVDDGSYHGTFTDLRLILRYNLLREPAMVTPFVSAVIPIRDYAIFAHAAPSMGLKQYLVGASVGRRLDPILEAGFAELRYSYAFQEKAIGISHDRSNADLEIGYFLTPSLGISAIANFQKSHGGIDTPCCPGTPAFTAFMKTPEYFYHNQLARSDYLNFGGIVSYALTGTVDVYASYQSMVWGRNIHSVQPGLAFGLSWGFSPKRVIRSFARKSSTSDVPAE